MTLNLKEGKKKERYIITESSCNDFKLERREEKRKIYYYIEVLQ
jgi:hypothetical protein